MGYRYNISNLYIQYVCNENNENIIFHRALSCEELFQNSITLDLGNTLCSIFNVENELKTIWKNIIDEVKQSEITNKDMVWNKLKIIFHKLINLMPCLEITHKYLTNTLSNVNIEPKQYCIDSINKYFSQIIDTIDWAKSYSFNNNNNDIYKLPSMNIINIKLSASETYTSMRSYNIYSFDELLRTLLYEVHNSKYHLKKCMYSNCNKFFIAKYGQERYCTNPCPDNPDKTCRDIRYYTMVCDNNIETISEPEWYKKLDSNLIPKKKQITSMYIYYINHSRGKKYNFNPKIILKNKIIFLEKCNKLRNLIKANGDNEVKWKKYYDIYEKFLNSVEKNIKSYPRIFKIEKPKY